MPTGDFDKARVFDRTRQGEDLGPLAAFGALRGEPGAAVADDRRHVGVSLNIVQHGRLTPEALHGRERRTRARLATVALDRSEQRRFLAANECTGTHADFQVELERGAEDVFAQQSACPGLLQRGFQPLYGQRVFGADVYVPTLGTDRETGDDHAFDDSVRIAFEDAAVHERAGIALVGVADDELLVALGVASELPLAPSRKPGPATAAKPRGPHRLDHFLGVVIFNDSGKGLVAVAGDVVLDSLRIDLAAVAKQNFILPLEEVHLTGVGDRAAVGALMNKLIDHPASADVLDDDVLDVLRLDVFVEYIADHQYRSA